MLANSHDIYSRVFCDVTIQQCTRCGHVTRDTEDDSPMEIYATEVLSCVPVTQQMIRRVEGLAEYLNDKIPKSSRVADIGGGSGELAFALADKGHNVDLFEPSLSLSNLRNNKIAGLNLMNYFFEPTNPSEYDCIVLKQVLEHLVDPLQMLQNIYNALKPDSILYLEIPSLEYIIENDSVVDFHYQHVHYFSRESIMALLTNVGFKVVDTFTIHGGHDTGYLLSKSRKPARSPWPYLYREVNPDRIQGVVNRGRSNISRLAEGRIALFGSGAYLQAFIGMLWQEGLQIHSIFDDSTISQGFHVSFPYEKQSKSVRIEEPSSSMVRSMDTIIICCYLHDRTVAQRLRDMGFDKEIVTLRSKSHKQPGIRSIFE